MSKTIAGALVGDALGAFGDFEQLRAFLAKGLPKLDPSTIQLDTVAGNMAALPQLQELGAALNRFNSQQTRAALEMQLPGMTQQAIDLTGSQLRGELTGGQLNFLSNRAAARAQTLGVGGGGFQLNLERMGMVEASMNRQQQGLSNYGALAQRLVPPQFDVTSMFFSPQQRLDFAFQDRAAHAQWNLLDAQVRAAPDPADVALGEAFDNFFETWKNVGMGALGGVMGGGGGQGPGGGGGGGGGGGWSVGDYENAANFENYQQTFQWTR